MLIIQTETDEIQVLIHNDTPLFWDGIQYQEFLKNPYKFLSTKEGIKKFETFEVLKDYILCVIDVIELEYVLVVDQTITYNVPQVGNILFTKA